MKTIKEEITNEIIINKSKFITIITPISNIENVKDKLEIIKKNYKDATHYCYAYIINSKEKCSDDGEPSGTAGIPILNILKTNNLTNVLCTVVRYFGGIKLGAGGLVRAYASSTKEILKKCEIGQLDNGYQITIEIDYKNIKNIDYLLKNYKIDKSFNEKIIYTFNINKHEYENIEVPLNNNSKIIKKQEITMIKDEI